MKQHHIKPALCYHEVKFYLESLHRTFPIVTIDEAAKTALWYVKGFH